MAAAEQPPAEPPSVPSSAQEASAAAEAGDAAALAAYFARPGVEPSVPIDPSTGETLLHVSAAAGQAPCVKACIGAGCKLAVLDNDEQNAMHYAANEGHLEVAKLLVSEGLPAEELNRLDKYQMSPLHLAVEGGHLELVRFLTALPHADEKIRRGSVTFIAQRHEHADIVELLQRPRAVEYDEAGNLLRGGLDTASEGQPSRGPSRADSMVGSEGRPPGGRTAAARRRSKAQSEDGGSVYSVSTAATNTRTGATHSAGDASAAPSRATTPRAPPPSGCCKGCAVS